jgi:riboflavin biosynthesis pyrimidine reductase
MDIEYKTLSTDELLEILTKNTMRYNRILLEGGPTDEFDMLREAIKTLQREVEKRKDEER